MRTFKSISEIKAANRQAENPPCLRFHPQSKDMYDFHPNCHSFAGGDCGFCYATKVESEGGNV